MMQAALAKEDKKAIFNKDFFDSDQTVCGGYESYSFEDYYLTFKSLCEIIIKHFHPTRVLDVGCAKGSFVHAFRNNKIEAYGVDVSEYAVSCAPENLRPFLRVVDIDNETLPFADNFFDFITFFGSIEYLKNHRHTITELERVMVDGGSLLLTTLYKRSKDNIYRTNIHSKAFWVKEFSQNWIIPQSYYNFMGSYFSRKTNQSYLSKFRRSIFGKSKFGDLALVSLWDVFVSHGFLNYGVLLFTIKKEHRLNIA